MNAICNILFLLIFHLKNFLLLYLLYLYICIYILLLIIILLLKKKKSYKKKKYSGRVSNPNLILKFYLYNPDG